MKRKVSKSLLSAMVLMLLTLGFSVTTLQPKAFIYWESVASVTQVDATYDSVTVQWTAAPGAAGYYIELDSAQIAKVDATTLSYTAVGLSENSKVSISVRPYAVDQATGEEDTGFSGYVSAKTLSRITNLGYRLYGFEYSNSPYQGLEVQWDYVANCDGYQAVLYKKNGKVVQTLNYTSNWDYYKAKFTKATRKQVYYVKVRSYVVLANGVQKFGDWSSQLNCIPDPIVTTKSADIGHYSIKMKWKKVTGASSYTIYVSNTRNKKGKKVATVKGDKTSYTITKVGKSKINTAKKTYYIRVIANAKFGKSTKKSKGYWCIYNY